MLETVGLAGFEDRYPHQLSGGESQRVAVARALAPQPKLILLDEPFSNLDPALRRSLRDEIKEVLLKVDATAILVTHDAEDALAVGDRIAVFRDAKIEQVGSPSELYHHPENAYCARIFGRANQMIIPGSDPEWVRPERMALLSERGSDHDVEVQIVQLKNVGRHIEVTVECLDRELWTLFLANGEELERGKKAWVRIESVSM
jgi:ABC-type sulfate/molybdate transport systems ATPase subunit